MNPRILITAAVTFTSLVACSHVPGDAPQRLPGSDRDARGCIPSAGYLWCGRSGQCERPWELAREKGFTLTEASFAAYCSRSD